MTNECIRGSTVDPGMTGDRPAIIGTGSIVVGVTGDALAARNQSYCEESGE